MLLFPMIRPAAAPPSGGGGLALTALLSAAPAAQQSGVISFSPGTLAATADRLLVVVLGMVNDSNDVLDAITVAGGDLAWTRRVGVGGNAYGYYGALEIWTAPSGAGGDVALSVSASVSVGVDQADLVIHAMEIANAAAAPVQTKTGAMSGTGAQSLTLDSAPASDGIVIGARYVIPETTDNQTAEPGAGWSEIYDNGAASAGYGSLQSQQRGGSTSTGVDWADGFVGAGNLAYGLLAALEIGKA